MIADITIQNVEVKSAEPRAWARARGVGVRLDVVN
jgi:hypothetical protein